ncbi:glycosyl transferase family 51 [Amylibacter ulvae]|uniref:peptidoglycan glycosyltransferase n=1 Tax=Paramylibacter ulvae TaxID=1651968 RepID=A0ABQ3D7E5_9RHOB|nr:transglycosylase domain-containing protein [Amylibacter ulvae]GHA59354.1 glycosyl transferase family 51 [Amylibacter ulvae]
MTNGSKDKHKLVAPKRHFPDPKASKKKPSKPTPAKSTRSSAKRKRKPVKKAGFIVRSLRAVGRLVWWTTSRFALVFGLVLGGFVAIDYRNLPDASGLMDERQRGSVTMLDHQGKTFAWRGDQFGGLVEPDTISPHLRNAVIATEDKRFYRHFGISPRGIAGAIRTNLREGRSALDGHGGSTITQQVTKDAYFLDLPSKTRKLKEVPMSLAMELKYTKDEILAIYLNRAYLGSGTNGFEAASQRYFGKSAREVNPAEAAMLAGLLKAPTRYAPTRNLERSQERANLIIGLMEAQGYLTKSQADDARTNPAQLSDVARERAGGYFADWVMEAAPEFIIKDAKQDVVIKTTFDKRIQKSAEDALKYIFEEKVRKGSKAQAAIVVLSKDGAVRAMVGGRHTGAEGSFNRATQALRQTGSAFKTFVYAAALESGYQYDSVVLDAPITIDIPGSGPWTPDNYLKGNYLGETTLTTALAKSINTTAVRISEDIGRKRVEAVAHDFGINRDLAPGPALALGASESTLLEMTGAYAGILNSGRLAVPYGLTALTIQGDPEPLLGKSGGTGVRVINDRAAEQLVYMMNQVVETGTGRRAKLDDREVAGKTGTTNSARDAWFIGFTGDYVAGVWMGYDDNSKLSGVTGGGLPAEIWKETMLRVHEGMPATPLNMIRPIEPPTVPEPEIATPAPRQEKRQTAEKPFEKFEKKLDKRMKKIEDDAENILNQILNSLKKKN